VALQQESAEHDEIARSPVVRIIEAYNKDILHYRSQCSLRRCPSCGRDSEGGIFFRRHAVRYRHILVIVGAMVYKREMSLLRWRCPFCNCTFTDYPSFVIPNKHYTLLQMRDYVCWYVLGDQASYRRGVIASNMPLFHDDGQVASAEASEREKENEAVPAMAHSTLHRWITTLGCSGNLSQEIIERTRGHCELRPKRLLQARSASAILPRKYRSQARKRVLEACRSL
jgi:hypothetical protein